MREVESRKHGKRLIKHVSIAAGSIALIVLIGVAVAPYFAGARSPDPILLRLGPLHIHWYGALIALSFVPALRLARPDAMRRGIDPDHLVDMLLIVVPLGLVGARLGYVVQNLTYFASHPAEVFAVWHGGLSIHGVLAFGAIGVLVYARRRRLHVLDLLDVTLPSVLLAQAIGRWGNFFNQELFGYPTDVPWKLFIDPQHRPAAFLDESFFHPTFLYESIWNATGVALLSALRRSGRLRRGDMTAGYLIFYSLGRFAVEFFRIGAPAALGLTLAQWVSAGLIGAGAGLAVAIRKRPVQNG